MRILITGGAGFIGSHLAERLVGQGHSVWTADNFSSGKMVNVVNKFPLWRLDCRYIDNHPGAHGFDFIYHLAATVGVKRVLENPAECIENNIESLRAVLGLGIPGLFTSTSEVYGRNESVLREDSEIVFSSKPRWSYAASKLIGEWMALQAGWKVVRLFNVVGPRQSSEYGAVLPNFVKQALAGEPLTVYGSGDQVRTFIDVRDCAEVLDRLREKKLDVVNVGGTHVMSIAELAARVNHELSGRHTFSLAYPATRFKLYMDAYPPGFEECPSRIPDLTKLDSLLPERQNTNFSKTIRDLADEIKPKTSYNYTYAYGASTKEPTTDTNEIRIYRTKENQNV